jgi:hypothetical protein
MSLPIGSNRGNASFTLPVRSRDGAMTKDVMNWYGHSGTVNRWHVPSPNPVQ